MTKLKIDGKEIEVAAGMTVIQACEQAGIEIPRFCYHDRLKIAGNCRMCLVEIKPGPPKPQASCAMPVAENMEVFTDTPMVRKAREGVMEFLLINHPLDCPICDQAGECDLQDQSLNYGSGKSHYQEHKRAVSEKYMGPLIKTTMTRCIHCTRCIRFVEDVAGVPELGAIGRGEHMEVTTYVEKAIASELSGNIVDLCPVGALTSRPYAFAARPWELKKVESIDVLDAVGSNIRVDVRGNAVLRILPRLHEEINEEWLGDKSRHACDGLRVQRLDKPYIRKNGKLEAVSWEEALAFTAHKLNQTDATAIAAIAGDLVSVEAVAALKDLLDAYGTPHRDCRQDGAKIPTAERSDYLFNTTIAGIEQADFVLLIGSNPRVEAPILNARIRKAWMQNGMKIAAIGKQVALTYPVEWLGDSAVVLNDILAGKHPLAEQLKAAQRPMIIVGQGALRREDGAEIHTAAKALLAIPSALEEGWNGLNMLHTAAARVGALDVGFVPAEGGYDTKKILEETRSGDIEVLYLLGADELDMQQIGGHCFVIYQGHHGDAGAHRADVIFPAAAYTEQDGLYVNTEGRPQYAYQAVNAPAEAKEDWKIIRALAASARKTLPYNTLSELRAKIFQKFPHLAQVDALAPRVATKVTPAKNLAIEEGILSYAIDNYYQTDAISRHSRVMAECSRELGQCSKRKEAA
jgi:NADH-quinone oxidoreductase subunit G